MSSFWVNNLATLNFIAMAYYNYTVVFMNGTEAFKSDNFALKREPTGGYEFLDIITSLFENQKEDFSPKEIEATTLEYISIYGNLI